MRGKAMRSDAESQVRGVTSRGSPGERENGEPWARPHVLRQEVQRADEPLERASARLTRS